MRHISAILATVVTVLGIGTAIIAIVTNYKDRS